MAPARGRAHHEVAAATGYEIRSHRVDFYGLCAACRAPAQRVMAGLLTDAPLIGHILLSRSVRGVTRHRPRM